MSSFFEATKGFLQKSFHELFNTEYVKIVARNKEANQRVKDLLTCLEENEKKITELEISKKEKTELLNIKINQLKNLESKVGSFYYFAGETVSAWLSIEELLRTDVFKKLVRFMANDIEEREQAVEKGYEHQFWFCQGAKSVLHNMLTMNEIIKKKIEYLKTKDKIEPGAKVAADMSYES